MFKINILFGLLHYALRKDSVGEYIVKINIYINIIMVYMWCTCHGIV